MQVLNTVKKFNVSEWLFMAVIFLSSVGKYLVMPFFAIYLTVSLGYSVGVAGVIISILIWSQRISAIASGPLADSIGNKLVIIIGLLLASVGCWGIAKVDSLYAIILYSIIFGIGGALPLPAIKATLANFEDVDKRIIFSIRKMAVNLGVVIGPLLGTLIFKYSRTTIFTIASIVFLLLAILSFIALEKISHEVTRPPGRKANVIRNMVALLMNKYIWFLMLCTLVFYAVFMQIELTFPLYIKETFSINFVWLLYVTNALIIILFQVPLISFLKKLNFLQIYSGGILFFLACFIMLTIFGSTLWLFIAAIILFSFGELLISPMLDVEASKRTSVSSLATVFGILGLASALGSCLGGIVGGHLYEFLHKQHMMDEYWLIICLFLIVSMTTIIMIEKNMKKRA